MLRSRKAVSTFIAVLLLMALAVAAGVVIYSYTMGYLGGMGGTSTMGTISLDTVTANSTSTTIVAYIRNIGQSTINFDKAYVDGVQIQDVNFTASPDPLPVEQVSTITIGVNMNSGTTYTVKVIGTDNTQLTFSVKAK
jgi:FlaG/FlaF family flagellin (archaellin)